MIRYLLRSLAAQVRGGLGLSLLTLSGVALGVASVLCVQILNASAVGAFRGGVRAVSGGSDLGIVGVLSSFPEDLYAGVLAEPGVAAAWPFYRVDAAVEAREDLFLEIIGLDLMNPMGRALQPGSAWEDAFVRTGWVAVTPQLARENGWKVGDSLVVSRGDRTATLVIGVLFDFTRLGPLAGSHLAVMDIAQVQALLGERGRLHGIEIVAAAGESAESLGRRIERRLGPAVLARTPAVHLRETGELLAAFRLNLTALSLVSLFVGLFLVYSTTQAFLVRRRREFGLLRALGAGRGQVLGLILAEVAVLGSLGTAVGLVLGRLVAAAGVDRVSRTLTSIYLLDEIGTLVVPASVTLVAVLAGIGGTAAGAMIPALETSRAQPRALLQAEAPPARAATTARLLFLSGLGLMLAAGVAHAILGARWRGSGFAMGVALVVGLPMLAPLTVRAVCGRARPRGFGIGYSLRSLVAQLQTTAFAVASLAVAVSMLIGTTVMIGSFRQTLDSWIRSTVQADLYVSARSLRRGGPEATLRPDLVRRLAARPEVLRVDRLRTLLLRFRGRQILVGAVDMGLPDGEVRFAMREGDAAQALSRAREAGAVLISEPLARRENIGTGGSLVLDGPGGRTELEVAGVYHDYGNERGGVFMDRERMDELFGAGRDTSVALYLVPGADLDAVAGRLRAELGDEPVMIRSHRRIRREALALFDQTFAITRILQAICLIVAICGVTLTLLLLVRSRISELALYRALGCSRWQIFGMFLGKGLGLALLGLLLGLAGGVVLALILVLVINPTYFGWTLQTHWPGPEILRQIGTILAAAVLASLYPALRARGVPVGELSRDDAG